MVIVSRDSAFQHYLDTKSSIWEQIFKENLTISIAMNIEQIQMNIHLNLQKPIKSVCRNAFLRFDTVYSLYLKLSEKSRVIFKKVENIPKVTNLLHFHII